MSGPILLAVPNVSVGGDREAIDAIATAFDTRLLDVHCDPDHDRSVFTLAGGPGQLAKAVLQGARETLGHVDLRFSAGVHPRIGALDVAPIVYLNESSRGAACAEALVLADLLGAQLNVPVFLYGGLAGGRTRAELRRGGTEALAQRMQAGELRPDFGPSALDPASGAVLVAARPPLVAFNLELEPPATLEQAQAIARLIREGGEAGLPSVRALGLSLASRGITQVSTNIEDYRRTSPGDVVAAVWRHAPVAAVELIGLAPEAALATLPDQIPIRNRATIEDALRDSA